MSRKKGRDIPNAANLAMLAEALRATAGRARESIGPVDVDEAIRLIELQRRQLSRNMRLAAAVSVFLVVTGMALLLATALGDPSGFRISTFVAALLLGIGVVPAVLILTMSRNAGAYQSQIYLALALQARVSASQARLVMDIWLQIERAIKTAFGKSFSSPRPSLPIIEMVRQLVESRRIAPETAERISYIQTMRNEIAHGLDSGITKDEMNMMERYARSVLADLDSVSERNPKPLKSARPNDYKNPAIIEDHQEETEPDE